MRFEILFKGESKASEHYSEIHVSENPNAETLKDVTAFIQKHHAPLRVFVRFSAHPPVSEEQMDALNTLDDVAQAEHVPVTLDLCNCCINNLTVFTKNPRWWSRWERC